MTYLLAQAVIPVSIPKLLLCLLILFAWAKWATIVDKDADYFQQQRRMWNAINLGAVLLAFLTLLLIPVFIVGLFLALTLTAGGATGYIIVRNKAVPEKFRWRLDADTFAQMLSERRQRRAERSATLRFKSAKGARPDLKPVPVQDDGLYEAHLRIEEILDAAMSRHAQGLEISGGEGGFNVVFNIDGVEYKHNKLPAEEALPTIDYLKLHCALDPSERRKQQEGECKIESEGHGTHDLKVRTSGSTRGIQCQVSFDPVKQVSIPYKELGLLEQQIEALKPVLGDTHGVVLVATPPRQGRTNTLYALAAEHDPYTMDIHIVETKRERTLESVTQHEVEAADMPKALRTLFLRDPHVVAVSAVTDQQTAQQIAQGAVEGKRIYAGLRADDTFTAMKLWLKAVGDRDLASKGLVAVISQRLVRKLCPFCRQKYKPDPAALKKLNLPADRIKELYKAGGKVVVKNEPEPCPACQGIGYMGRSAAFEVVVIDDEGRKFLKAGALDQLRTRVRRKKTLWLEEAALAKVVAGETSIGETMRAMGHEQKSRE